MPMNKINRISVMLEIKDLKNFILEQYKSGMSATEISEWINERTKPYITITNKSISNIISKMGQIRNKKESFKLAIERGRMIYKTKEKPFKRYSISLKQRYTILLRDGFKCKACGSKEYLEIDHIIPIGHGGTNEPDNLQVLCRECNYGKMMNEIEYFKNSK